MRTHETSHFWVGFCSSQERLASYLHEDYDRADDDQPISEFAADQVLTWYDHDFLEVNFCDSANSIAELVAGCSYHEQYAEELSRRAGHIGVPRFNTLIFITDSEVPDPRPVQKPDISLYYLGTITYKI